MNSASESASDFEHRDFEEEPTAKDLEDALDVTQNRSWSVEEKQQLLKAMQAFGVEDPAKLAACIPSRSETQVSLFLHQLSKKAKTTQSAACKVLSRKTPIDIWRDFSLNCRLNTSDHSRALINAFEAISQDANLSFPDTSSSPNYSRIYSYLAQVLNGVPPPLLTPTDSHVVLGLLNSLNETLNSLPPNQVTNTLRDHATKLQQMRKDPPKKNGGSAAPEQQQQSLAGGESVYVSALLSPVESNKLYRNPFNVLDIPVECLKRLREEVTRIQK